MGAQSNAHLHNVPSHKLLRSRTTLTTSLWQIEGGSFIQLEKLLKQFLQTKTVTMTILIVGKMLNIVLIVKMSQLMKRMIWKMTALFCPLQTFARMLKLFQMTKEVIVLPLELCTKFCFLYLVNQNIYQTCFYYMYILYCRQTCHRF